MPKKRAVKPVVKRSKVERAISQGESMKAPRTVVDSEFQYTIDPNEPVTVIEKEIGSVNTHHQEFWKGQKHYTVYRRKAQHRR